MTIKKISQEINARITFLEKKRDSLIVREMDPRDMRKLKELYEDELDALFAARRGMADYLNKNSEKA